MVVGVDKHNEKHRERYMGAKKDVEHIGKDDMHTKTKVNLNFT
jgi:hypothetical protein